MKGKLVIKGLFSFSILAASVLIFIVGGQYLQNVYQQKLDQQIHSTKVIALAQRIQLDCTDVILCGFAQRIVKTPTNRGPQKQADLIEAHKQLCAELATEPSSQQQARKVKLVHELKILCDRITRDATQLSGPSQSDSEEGFGEFTALMGSVKTFNTLRIMIERLGEDIIELTEPYKNLSTNAEKELTGIRNAMNAFSIAGSVAVFFALGTFLWFMNGVYGSLRVLVQNTQRLAKSQPLLPLNKEADDELGQLDLQFRDMAAALDAANRRTRATIDYAGDIICVLDRESKILEVNPAARDLLGWTSEEIKQLGLNEIIVTDDRDKLSEGLAKATLQTGKVDFDCQMRTASGATLHCDWTVQWSPVEQEMFCVVHDFTDRKRVEQMKKQFFDMISHDMRTPLSSVALGVQAVTQSEAYQLPPGATKMLKKAENNASLLIRMINDLLDMDKLETGKMELSYSEFSLKAICDEALGIVEPLAERRQVVMQGPRTDVTVVADADRILRVIINLVANAIKFSPKKGEIVIDIKTRDHQVEVSVIDQGRGIPPEMCEAVFDRFTQVEVGDATKKGGSGLGLAICKAFVELHDGQIGVDSELSKGSRFWFRIPVISEKREELVPEAISITAS